MIIKAVRNNGISAIYMKSRLVEETLKSFADFSGAGVITNNIRTVEIRKDGTFKRVGDLAHGTRMKRAVIADHFGRTQSVFPFDAFKREGVSVTWADYGYFTFEMSSEVHNISMFRTQGIGDGVYVSLHSAGEMYTYKDHVKVAWSLAIGYRLWHKRVWKSDPNIIIK